ncbi:HNH endonuclease signature motif containing protein [Zhihengliuella halotolerans]|uniref:HNH endonuclease signature motif containing protein n=1 Tax=Zhihengliuella halotolerans TaxID=370736 RepID=UPI000C7FA46D|nr:HNH endonuclease signature motif containing protein [Zhihengliuella halotolerans]
MAHAPEPHEEPRGQAEPAPAVRRAELRRYGAWQDLLAAAVAPAYAFTRQASASASADSEDSAGVNALSSLIKQLGPATLLAFSEDLHRFAAACGHEAIAGLEAQAQREVPAHLEALTTISDGMEISVGTGRLRERASLQVTAQHVAVARDCTLQTATRDVERARVAHDDTPEVLAALASGRIGLAHAQTMIDLCRRIEPERVDPPLDGDPVDVATYDQNVMDAELDCRARRQDLGASLLGAAPGRTPGSVKRSGTRMLNRLLGTSASDRYAAARKKRHVRITAAEDGMCRLSAYLPALAGEAIENRLTELATLHTDRRIDAAIAERYPAEAPVTGQNSDGTAGEVDTGTDRTRAQTRADALVELLLAGPDGSGLENVVPTVTVTIPATVFPNLAPLAPAPRSVFLVRPATGTGSTGADEERTSAAQDADERLEGLRLPAGAVVPEAEVLGAFDPADLAAILPQAKTWTRIVTDPWTGAMTAIDTNQYRPTAAMRRALALRDRTCRVPGCGRRASACEPDHVVERQHGGATSLNNLVSICKRCHRLKSWGLLRLSLDPDGTVHATTWWDQERAGTADAPWDTQARPLGDTNPNTSRHALGPVESALLRELSRHLEWVNRRATGHTVINRPPAVKNRELRRVNKLRDLRRQRGDKRRHLTLGAPDGTISDRTTPGQARAMTHLGYAPEERREFHRDAANAAKYPAWLGWNEQNSAAAAAIDEAGADTDKG